RLRRDHPRPLVGKLGCQRGNRDACNQPLEVHREIDPRQRLVEIIDVEYEVLLRGRECPEVHQMAVAASLDGNARARLMLRSSAIPPAAPRRNPNGLTSMRS